MTSTIFSTLLSPGVYLRENTAGSRPADIISHITAYMVGSASTGEVDVPTQVLNITDFINQYGSSLSEASIRMFFRNDPTGQLFFIRCGIAARYTLDILSFTAGTVDITVNGVECEVVFGASENADSARDKVIDAINLGVGATVTAVANPLDDSQVFVFAEDHETPLTVSSSDALKISAVSSTPTQPTAVDFVRTIETLRGYEYEELPQGFLIAPEAFQELETSSDRLTVGNTMRDVSIERDWLAVVDCPEAADTVAELSTDGINYTAPIGHLMYVAPYGITSEGETVPLSAGVVGSYILKMKTLGYQEPPGGTRFQIKGVTSLTVNFTRQQQDVLNPLGINLVRNLRNKGVCLWGMRTRSNDVLYRFANTRVIMNVLNGSLLRAFDQYLFSSIGGTGIVLHRIEETAISILRRMYNGGALFGATEQDAFACICSVVNNDPSDLENGNVLLEVYAAPVPGIEKILILSHRVAIGQIQSSRNAGRAINND